MADNTPPHAAPADHDHEDWFEIYNPRPGPADLSGFYLTDNLTNKFQYLIPAGYTIPPGGHLLVWADNKRQIGLRLVAGHKSELHRRRCHLAASQQQKAARPQ